MTGPEHYRKAERLLDGVNESLHIVQQYQDDPQVAEGVALIGIQMAAAQAHATLALAAATADPLAMRSNTDDGGAIDEAWVEALS